MTDSSIKFDFIPGFHWTGSMMNLQRDFVPCPMQLQYFRNWEFFWQFDHFSVIVASGLSRLMIIFPSANSYYIGVVMWYYQEFAQVFFFKKTNWMLCDVSMCDFLLAWSALCGFMWLHVASFKTAENCFCCGASGRIPSIFWSGQYPLWWLHHNCNATLPFPVCVGMDQTKVTGVCNWDKSVCWLWGAVIWLAEFAALGLDNFFTSSVSCLIRLTVHCVCDTCKSATFITYTCGPHSRLSFYFTGTIHSLDWALTTFSRTMSKPQLDYCDVATVWRSCLLNRPKVHEHNLQKTQYVYFTLSKQIWIKPSF